MDLNDYEFDERLYALPCPDAPGNTWIPTALLRDLRLSAAARCVGCLLALELQRGGRLPSLDWIAEHTPTDPATLDRLLAELEKNGWIRPRPRRPQPQGAVPERR